MPPPPNPPAAPPAPPAPAAPEALAAPVAPKAPMGVLQQNARSFFKKAATAEQKGALQQQKEQQLATDQAKLQQAKAEQAEQRAEEAAMKRPPGRSKRHFSLTGQLGCEDTERTQGHGLAGALALSQHCECCRKSGLQRRLGQGKAA